MPVLPNPPGRGGFSPSQPPAAPQKRHRAAVRARGRRPSCLRAAGSWHPREEHATVPLLYLQSLPTAVISSRERGSLQADDVSGAPEASREQRGRQQGC